MTASTRNSPAPFEQSLQDSALPPWWGRLETLWLLVAPLCALLYTLCLPLAPNDLWYHVRAGELIARGAIPTQNLMSSAIPFTAPYYYQSWLAELGLFWTLKFGGLSGLAILRALCVTGALALVVSAAFRQLLRRPNPPARLVAARGAAFGAVVALAMASNNVDLRPQTFSTLFFGAWIFAVLEWRAPHSHRRLWAALLVILTLIWANTHGAFILSILGLGALALGDFVARRNIAASLGVTMASGAAALINPRGAALYAYVANLSRDQISQKWVQEWKSPGIDEWHSALFWICAAATIAALALSLATRLARNSAKTPARGDLGWPLLLLLFGVMAARDQRAIIWFALAFAPSLTWFVLRPAQTVASCSGPPPVPRAAQWINALLLGVLLALPLALLPQFKNQFPWPAEFRHRFAPSPTSIGATLFADAPPLLLERTTPVAAAQWLLRNPPRGRLFTDMVCGSYLTYAGRGRIVPLCDPRIELFPAAFWEDYLRLSTGPADASTTLQKRGFSDALLDRDTMPALVKRLRASSQWRIVAQNGSTVLFRHFNSQNIK